MNKKLLALVTICLLSTAAKAEMPTPEQEQDSSKQVTQQEQSGQATQEKQEPSEAFRWRSWASRGLQQAMKVADEFREEAHELLIKAEDSVVKGVQAFRERLAGPKLKGKYDKKANLFLINAKLEGYDPKNIVVELHPDKMVTIEGSKKVAKEVKDEATGKMEQEVSEEQFKTAYKIPDKITVTNMKCINAVYKKDVLTISIPAKKEKEVNQDESVQVPVITPEEK